MILDQGSASEKLSPTCHPNTVAVLHARRCGWFSGQQLGMLQLEEARAAGSRGDRGASRVDRDYRQDGCRRCRVGTGGEILSVSDAPFCGRSWADAAVRWVPFSASSCRYFPSSTSRSRSRTTSAWCRVKRAIHDLGGSRSTSTGSEEERGVRGRAARRDAAVAR